MRMFAFAAGALLALSVPAAAQDAMKPCKPSRQASRDETTGHQPDAQTATGAPAQDDSRQMANSSACENSPPDTR